MQLNVGETRVGGKEKKEKSLSLSCFFFPSVSPEA
jgi:hypothetical protein